jgi:hypothetical protein
MSHCRKLSILQVESYLTCRQLSMKLYGVTSLKPGYRKQEQSSKTHLLRRLYKKPKSSKKKVLMDSRVWPALKLWMLITLMEVTSNLWTFLIRNGIFVSWITWVMIWNTNIAFLLEFAALKTNAMVHGCYYIFPNPNSVLFFLISLQSAYCLD